MRFPAPNWRGICGTQYEIWLHGQEQVSSYAQAILITFIADSGRRCSVQLDTIIVRAENLPAARTEVDLLWMPGIDRDTEGGTVRCHTTVKALPGLAQVSATQHTPRSTAKVLTDAGVEGMGSCGAVCTPRE